MALITPSNLGYIISLSFMSRIWVFIVQFISNLLVTDHAADAYRNKYHNALTTNLTTNLVLPDTYLYFYKSIQGLTKWDAQYFLEISTDGYKSEQHLAFLPLFPVIISTVRQIVFAKHRHISFQYLIPQVEDIDDGPISTDQLEKYIQSAVVGFVLNNFIFFPIASIALFALTKLVKRKDDKYAKLVVWWFCFNPASIFFSACYTESLFAALTFTAMFMIEYKAHNYLSNPQEELGAGRKTKTEGFVPISQLNRILKICMPSLVLLALSTATRSNGLITIGFLIYQFLIKYAPLGQTSVANWSILVYVSLVLECLQDVLVLIMSSVVAASGYITFQIYSYGRFCLDNYRGKKGTLKLQPEWCSSLVPHPYGQVQAKYWNVGLFKYYQFKQLPNFLLAFPISYLVLVESLRKSKEIALTRNGKRHLVYYVQGILLTIFCGISINVQVTTRLLASSCPVIYWICTDLARESRFKDRMIALYFITYFVLGTILHSNFYPWT